MQKFKVNRKVSNKRFLKIDETVYRAKAPFITSLTYYVFSFLLFGVTLFFIIITVSGFSYTIFDNIAMAVISLAFSILAFVIGRKLRYC